MTLSYLDMEHATCAATGCDEPLGARIVLCPRHWDMCPDALVDPVVDAWNSSSREEFRAARKAMITAVNAEIARMQEGATP